MTLQSDIESSTWQMSPDLMGFLAPSGRFESVNPAWERILGWSVSEVLAEPFSAFLHPDDVEPSLAAFEAIKRGQSAFAFVNRYRGSDDRYRWISWNAAANGDVFFCIGRDVTDEVETRRMLQMRDDEAALRERFLAVLGHDLRNPLASIGSAVRLARRGPDEARLAMLLDAIDGSADRMAKLIDGILDFAHVRMGDGLPMAFARELDLAHALTQVIAEVERAHPDRPFDVALDIAEPLICDVSRIEQVVSNLVANAVSHGAADVPIRVRAETGMGEMRLTVCNGGDAIPQDAQATLFEPFTRGGAEAGDDTHGLGLGLYISAEIARAHGGTLDVTSDAAATCFTLTIPLMPPRAAAI
ncbi:MAG: PAS domain-containing sensor histidine kinase [Shimia sp.]